MSLIGQGQFWKLLQIDDTNPEYQLFESVICEFTDISGWDVHYYIKQPSEKLDYLYGEDPNSEFTEAFDTKLIYEPSEETSLLDSFGISSDDLIQIAWMPKSIFIRDVSENYEDINYIPKPGDCIRTLWNNLIYEIVDKGEEDKIFQGRKMIFEFALRPYRHSKDSESADDMAFEIADEFDFPGFGGQTETETLSGHGDNTKIGKESKNNYSYDGKDTKSLYGYDTLD